MGRDYEGGMDKTVPENMTDENDLFTCNNVLFADILGHSKHTLEQKEEAENNLKKFGEIYSQSSTIYPKLLVYIRTMYCDYVINQQNKK